jgi:hypothetical protein
MEAADKRAASLAARLTSGEAEMAGGQASGAAGGACYANYWRADDGDRPFFHPVDAGLPVISLLLYVDIADEAGRAKALEAIKKSLGFELTVTAEVANPFGYSRQLVQSKGGPATRRTSFFFAHDTETAPWWQGENARLGSMAAAARLAARHFGATGDSSVTGGAKGSGEGSAAGGGKTGGTGDGSDGNDAELADKLRAFGRDQINWILGLNPFDACMLHGKGRNNIPYMFFDSYEYTNAPGGICNGITGGYTDEEDIDFGLRFAVTGKDDDWRWGEQWLPHAAWYLLAVAIGD